MTETTTIGRIAERLCTRRCLFQQEPMFSSALPVARLMPLVLKAGVGMCEPDTTGTGTAMEFRPGRTLASMGTVGPIGNALLRPLSALAKLLTTLSWLPMRIAGPR